jgi:hypothetical protein
MLPGASDTRYGVTELDEAPHISRLAVLQGTGSLLLTIVALVVSRKSDSRPTDERRQQLDHAWGKALS